MKKIRLFEVCRTLGLGGVERIVKEFAINVDKSKFDVIVGAYDISGPIKKILEENNVEVIQISNENLLTIIKEKNIDLVHSHNIHIKQFIGKTKNVHKVVFAEGFSEKAEINLIISKTLALKLNSVKKLQYGKNYYVLYNPQNVDSWRKSILPDNEIAKRRRVLGITDNDIVIGRLGRTEPAKVDYLLLKSAPLIAKKFPNVKFIFFGLPKLYKFFLERNKYLAGRVIFMPQTPDDENVAEFYQIIDIFWHTACRGETFGNVITEAMIFKKPVITHSTPFKISIFSHSRLFKILGNMDIDNAQIEIVDHMKTGLVANYPEDVVEAISFFCNNPQKIKEFGENGYNKVLKFYDAKVVVRQFERIVEALMTEKKVDVTPSKSEIEEYFKNEYAKRLKNRIKATKNSRVFIYKFQKLCYKLFLEFPYLVIRFILREYFKKNIEN